MFQAHVYSLTRERKDYGEGSTHAGNLGSVYPVDNTGVLPYQLGLVTDPLFPVSYEDPDSQYLLRTLFRDGIC